MELSQEMLTKANWVAEMMQEDGIAAGSVTQELIMAYMQAITRKIETIQGIYLTRNGAQEAMADMVLAVV